MFEKVRWERAYLPQRIVIPLASCLMLFGLYRANYLLFHSVVEMMCVVVAGAIFLLTWNARHHVEYAYIAILGAGYLTVSILDLLHTVGYPGMGVMPNLHADAGMQLWVAARYVESATLFCASVFIARKIHSNFLPAIAVGLAVMLATAILVWRIFPTVNVPDQGVTFFKIGSECFIIFILLASLDRLRRIRRIFKKDVWLLLVSALWVTIVSEMAFIFNGDVEGFIPAAGLFLKLVSIFLIYLAIVATALLRPRLLVADAVTPKKAAVKEREAPSQTKINQTVFDGEAKFRLLVDKIEGVFWIVAVDLQQIIYLSPGFEKIWQRPCSQVYAEPGSVERTIHPKDRQRVMTAMKSAPKNGWDLEFRILRPDGSTRWIRDHGYPVEDADGEIVQLCGMSHDITRQKRMEFRLVQAGQSLEQRVATHTKALSTAVGYLKAQVKEKSRIGAELRERNLMLKALVKAIPDMVSYKDSRGRYLIANPAHKDFFGLKGTSVIGRTDSDISTIQTPKSDAERERLVMQKGKTTRFESVLCSASGCTSHWDIRIVPVKGAGGKLSGILTLARDISPFKQREFELQQSKALLQAFLNGISDPMLMIDNDLRPVYLNRAASKAYSTMIQGQDTGICGQILCDQKGQCDVCKVKIYLKSKKPVSFERRTAGSDRVEKIYMYPLSGEKNGLDGAVVRVADITEAKGLERHLIHSEKMNALGMLVAGMVHEINNPNSFITFNLPILRAYLEKIFVLLDSHPATVANKDWFGMDYPAFRREIFSLTDNLSHGSSRIDNIISNLKSMTHPKEVSNRRKWVDLFEVVDKAVMLCRSEVRKRVKVFEVKPPRHSIQLKTDPEALEQVIINLLINASHAADKRDSWVRIEALLGKDKHNHVVIEVRDNGCGMTQETMARIFDPFFTTKGPGVGTGLGLSVSYNLIRQLGGQILVDSKPEKGTRFKVVLPLESGAQAGVLLTTEKEILPDKRQYLKQVKVKKNI